MKHLSQLLREALNLNGFFEQKNSLNPNLSRKGATKEGKNMYTANLLVQCAHSTLSLCMHDARGTFHKMSSEFPLTKLSEIVITKGVFFFQHDCPRNF